MKKEKIREKGKIWKREETRPPKEGFAEKENTKKKENHLRKREIWKREEKQPAPIAIVPESIKEEKKSWEKRNKRGKRNKVSKRTKRRNGSP